MLLDLLHLSRSRRRSPASAAAAILTLSLTLGAGAAIFAVVDAVVLAPLPFANPDALVTVSEVAADDPRGAPRAVPYATFEGWRARAGSLAAIEAYDPTNLTLTAIGSAERVNGANVTPGFLGLLGVAPALGRAFDRDDVGRPIAIVSHAFWRGRLAGDAAAIGRPVLLGGQAHTIVGVLPERFAFALSNTDLWRPFPVTPAEAARRGDRVRAVARLAPNVSAAHLAAALDDAPRETAPRLRVVATLVAAAIAGEATRTLGLLAGAAALAMLIACTNLAGLLMVRSVDRRRELAVRSALGASRSEITRQLLLEAGALVALGAAGGVLLALWMTPVAGRLALEQFGDLARRDVAVSWRVIGIVSIAAAACAWICGLLPAMTSAQDSLVDALRQGATPPPREMIVRRVFVCAQVALAFVLVASVALLGRSLLRALTTDPGFDARGVLTLHVSLPSGLYASGERVASFYATLHGALEQRLGARATAIVDEIPLTGDQQRSLVSVRRADVGREAIVRSASPGYFDVMHIPMVAGRSFEAGDAASAPARVVVSEPLAERLFGSEPPIGRQIWIAAIAQPADVIGVAGEVKHRTLDEASPGTVYLPAARFPSHSSIVVVRSARPDADVVAAVRGEVARLDRNLPVYGVRSMREVVSASPGVPVRRVLTATVAAFAILAVALGAIGLFGVVAHDVARRRRELGLRIALGADPMRILRATLGRGAAMVGSGLAVGGMLSIWAARALGAVLVAADRLDAATIALAAGVLVAASAAAVLPAVVRAARTDPLIALRSE